MFIPMIDYLYFGVLPLNYMEAIEPMIEELSAKKEMAKVNQLEKPSEKIIINIGSMDFEIKPNGTEGFAYILNNNNFQIKLSKYLAKNENFYPIKVNIRSEALWLMTPSGSYNYIISWLEHVFGEIKGTKISRMDLCCHTDKIAFNNVDIKGFKGNFKKQSLWLTNRELSGIDFGVRGSKVFCRIYNKQLEILEKNYKRWFYDVWQNKGWNKRIVWNIEFELKRDFFADYKIDSVEDAFARLQSMWEYCTSNWLVLTNNDRSRVENSTINNEWEKVQIVFNDLDSEPLIKREKQMQYEASAILPSVVGYITTYGARLNTNNPHEIVDSILRNGTQYLEKKNSTFKNATQEKIDLMIPPKKGGE